MPQRKAQPATATVSSSIPQPPVTKAQNGRDSGNRGKGNQTANNQNINHLQWLRELDENRKFNIILSG